MYRLMHGLVEVRLAPEKGDSFGFLGSVAQEIGQMKPEDFPEILESGVPTSLVEAAIQGLRINGAATNYPAYTWDAVWAAALALSQTPPPPPQPLTGAKERREARASFGEEVFQNLLNVSFQGSTGEVRFDAVGDRAVTSRIFDALYFDENQRRFVVAATFPDNAEVVELLPMVWSGNTTDVPKDGTSCQPGESFRSDSLSCEPCPAGYFSADGKPGGCIPCAPGAFCEAPGCPSCAACPSGTYQGDSAAVACVPCPPNMGTETRRAQSLLECVCNQEYEPALLSRGSCPLFVHPGCRTFQEECVRY